MGAVDEIKLRLLSLCLASMGQCFVFSSFVLHYNPIRLGLGESPVGSPYSSFHRFVEAGIHS
jgi:hypothetical protein